MYNLREDGRWDLSRRVNNGTVSHRSVVDFPPVPAVQASAARFLAVHEACRLAVVRLLFDGYKDKPSPNLAAFDEHVAARFDALTADLMHILDSAALPEEPKGGE